MPIRKEFFAQNEIIHLFGRGVRKSPIFHDRRDYARFLFTLMHFQSTEDFSNLGVFVTRYIKKGKFGLSNKKIVKNLQSRIVKVISFIIMPNHYHICIKLLADKAASIYMQRVLTAYSKYYNEKYKVTGHVFEGPFRAVHVKSNEQLLYLSTYIHRNAREISGYKNKEEEYEWSSCSDYLKVNRWGTLLETSTILGQFENPKQYWEFQKMSIAKLEKEIELPEGY